MSFLKLDHRYCGLTWSCVSWAFRGSWRSVWSFLPLSISVKKKSQIESSAVQRSQQMSARVRKFAISQKELVELFLVARFSQKLYLGTKHVTTNKSPLAMQCDVDIDYICIN